MTPLLEGHIIVGETYSSKSDDFFIWGETLQWTQLYSKRCDYEVLCRWHDLTVPQAQSTTFQICKFKDDAQVIEHLNKKISEMEKTLELFHALDDLIFQGADEEEH